MFGSTAKVQVAGDVADLFIGMIATLNLIVMLKLWKQQMLVFSAIIATKTKKIGSVFCGFIAHFALIIEKIRWFTQNNPCLIGPKKMEKYRY